MLIILSGILFYLCQIKRKKVNEEAFADSILFIILFTFVITQIYSALHLIERQTILLTWAVLLFFLLLFLCIHREKSIHFYQMMDVIKDKEFRMTKIVLGLICLIMLLLSAKTITANWDSMTYHMARIMHWIQNKSVAFYATNEERQITSPPLVEYLIMNVMLLTGSDRFVCMVQGVSYVLSAGLVYSIARKLKMEKKYAYLAVFFFLMMPPAIAEAVTTQNDLFSALLMLLFFYYYLDFLGRPALEISKESLLLAAKLGATIAMGYLAKSNVLIPMAVFIVYLGILKLLNKEKIKNILVLCVVGIGTVIMGVCPFLFQSYKVYGSLLPKSQTEGIMPESMSIRLLIANVYKNIAKYTSTPLVPGINDFLMKGSRAIEKLFHIDINDAAISTVEFRLPDGAEAYHCDTATNPLVVFLCFLIVVGMLFRICQKAKLEMGMFFCMVIGVLMTAAMSKYSPWKVRYFLPCSAVAVVLSTFFIAQMKIEYRWKEYFVGFLICLGMLSGYGAFHYTKETVEAGYYGNEDGDYSYFVNQHIRGPYNDIKAYIEKEGYRQIGFYFQGGSYEYPLWVYLEQAERMEHVLVGNTYLKELEDFSFQPECIISINKGEWVLGQALECHGENYICSYVSPHDANYAVFVIE